MSASISSVLDAVSTALQDPANLVTILASTISAGTSILTAILAAVVTLIAAAQRRKLRYLEQRQLIAQHDILFLLAVEEEHCQRNVKAGGSSEKLKVRNATRDKGLVWSGKFTASRSAARNARLGISEQT